MVKRCIRHLLIIFLFALLLVPSVIVKADVVWDNDFANKNEYKIKKLEQIFYVNGENGSVSIKEKPGSDIEIMTFMNGETLYIRGVYLHKGEYWGIMESLHMYNPPGWIPMEQLLTYYDHPDFATEYQDKLYDYEGGFEKLIAYGEFYVWQWPGSDREKLHYIVKDYKEFSNDDNALNARYAYMDDEGREWVYVYILGGPNYGGPGHIRAAGGWICVSNPDIDKIPAFNPAPEPQRWEPDESYDDYFGKVKFLQGLIVAFIAVLGVFIFLLIRALVKSIKNKLLQYGRR